LSSKKILMVTPKQIDGDCHIKEKSRRVSHQNMVQHEDQTKVMVTVTSKQRRVWRYQRDNQNLYIQEEQTTQWPKEKIEKDKQRSTKHTHKTKDRVTRIPLKTNHDEGHNKTTHEEHVV
jgi:CHAT domain-containing protein